MDSHVGRAVSHVLGAPWVFFFGRREGADGESILSDCANISSCQFSMVKNPEKPRFEYGKFRKRTLVEPSRKLGPPKKVGLSKKSQRGKMSGFGSFKIKKSKNCRGPWWMQKPASLWKGKLPSPR